MTHSSGVFELWSDPDVCRYSGVVTDYDRNIIPMPATSSANSDRIIDFWLRAAEDGWGFRWAIMQAGRPDAFVGMIGFNTLHICAEIAYHLLPAHWGRGLMLEAARAAVAWVNTNGARELEAFIEQGNSASIALAERLGMSATDEFSEGARRYLSISTDGQQ